MADTQAEIKLMVDRQLRARGVRDEAVLAAMANVPRHRFVPTAHRAEAYADRALPNAEGQTISQPYIVGLMTELLDLAPPADAGVARPLRVLEIGTGSGYQTAILVALGAKVATIERNARLSAAAQRLLTELDYAGSVSFHIGDGTLGWAAEAPYDRILVTAAAPQVPPAYRRQLANFGKIVIPVGGRQGDQALFVVERHGEQWRQSRSTGCVFVPLIGQDGWPD